MLISLGSAASVTTYKYASSQLFYNVLGVDAGNVTIAFVSACMQFIVIYVLGKIFKLMASALTRLGKFLVDSSFNYGEHYRRYEFSLWV